MKIQTYFETKTWTELQDNTHNHQTITLSPEYSQVRSCGTIKSTVQQEAYHSYTNASNKNKYNCEQGLKQPETIRQQIFQTTFNCC